VPLLLNNLGSNIWKQQSFTLKGFLTMTRFTTHEETTGVDPLTKAERSARMAGVHSKGNRSTEGQVEMVLLEAGISGWEKHSKDILGRPDFFFPNHRLVIFVNGCFWHVCPVCKRRTPKSDFWRNKLEKNRKRDNRIHRDLRQQGYHVMRIWEHELKRNLWFKRLQAMIRRIEKNSEKPALDSAK
jgi:DNA mismatch endonuclease (patch repair protein)